MKRAVVALMIASFALTAAQAAPKPAYTLQYLDNTRNVRSVGIAADGSPATRALRLTSGGGYGGYSISPDGKQVFAWRQIGFKYGDCVVAKCYLEKNGKPEARIPGILEGDPSADWSPLGKYMMITVSEQVATDTTVYSLERRKIVYDTMDLLPDFSYDEAYSFVLEDRGDEDNSPAWLRVLDMRTGKTAKVTHVNFGTYGEPVQNVWFGRCHSFAFIDTSGRICAAQVGRGKSGPVVRKWILTKGGGCADIRYIPGKGIYFTQKSGKIVQAYHSSDLRTLKKAAILPAKAEERWSDYMPSENGKLYSSDRLIYATVEAGKPGEGSIIRIHSRSGKIVQIARGTSPTFKLRKRY